MEATRKNRMIAGATLMLVGLGLFWLEHARGIGQEWILFVIGAVFLTAYLYGRNYGLLIPGCVMLGLAAGSFLGDQRWLDNPSAFGLGAGFVAVYVVALLYERKSHWWPLIPGGVLVTVGLAHGEQVLQFLQSNWPLALVVIGAIILLGALGRSTPGRESR